MHLVKWIRKNMGKLMAIFVIVIMIAFIMPSLLDQLSRPSMRGPNAAMWTYNGDKEITLEDIQQASAELKILSSLMADRLLLAQQDIRSILLSQLLFPESERAAMISDELKNIVMQNRLLISPLKIDEFFRQSRGRSELFYLLLKNEAANAGVVVAPKTAGDVLNSVIPQLTNKQADAATLVNGIAAANGMSGDQVLKVFANLMSIMTYSRVVTETENVTESQLKNIYARATQSMDVNFVQFSSEEFTDKVAQPSSAQLTGQFEQFKNILPGTITEENPVGFGYKLPSRVAIDYMIIKLDDLKKNIPAPTNEEIEDYYRQNLERPPITTEVPKDPNDPNSEMVKKQKSFAEVAETIKRVLQTRKINSTASKILSEAIEKTDGDFQSLDFEKATVETFKAKAGDYAAVSQEISAKYNVKVYNGRTALLTQDDIQGDASLGGLMMMGQSRMPTRLVKLAFAVPALGDEAAKLGPFEPAAPKMFVSIGPLSDMGGGLTAIARVVEVAISQAPESLEFSYEKNLPDLGKENDKDSKFVLKDVVSEDCKKLLATEIAEKAANEFMQLVKNQDWDSALNKINAQYGKKDANDPNAKTFAIQPMNNIKRISERDIEMTKMRVAGMMASEQIVNQSIMFGRLIDTFYDTYEQMQKNQQQPPVLVDFDPRLSYYVIKDMNVTDAGTLEEFEQIRQRLALEQDFIDSQSAVIDFLMPDNITGRSNLEETQKSTADANDTNQPAEEK
ncbi:MAG: hypothetical protein A2Y10_11220 [Planctomycetes bacterium GWF2_41_51]|nr:MAG: hypothetical protein A2Y10_11220 [Planctomycetes bacterium GWF2_41_51]HBG28380.1 hypothetical protein [Phycisphaerales bacterium]